MDRDTSTAGDLKVADKKHRSELTQKEIDALPDDHPWKHENFFHLAGLAFTPAENEVVERREREDNLLAEQGRRERLEAHYKSGSGVPARYLSESLATFHAWNAETEAAVQKARDFSRQRGCRTLVLCGSSGSGKTHLGCGIIRERGGIYRTMLKLLYEVDGTMSYKAKETKVQLLDRICTAPMLVLDEIARCKIREETQQELVCYVLNERYANNLPTVLITNLDKKELVKWLGFAAKDRLNECGMVIELNCESYRIKKRREVFSGG